MLKAFSNRKTISRKSMLSAPRSCLRRAVGLTCSSSTPRASTSTPWTLEYTSSRDIAISAPLNGGFERGLGFGRIEDVPSPPMVLAQASVDLGQFRLLISQIEIGQFQPR